MGIMRGKKLTKTKTNQNRTSICPQNSAGVSRLTQMQKTENTEVVFLQLGKG